MKTLDKKLIIYDSNCKVCAAFRDLVLKFTSIPEEKVKAYAELPPGQALLVDREKFKNVMALIDTSGGNTLYGADGVAYIFSSQYKIANLLLGYRPLFKLFSLLYKIQAYNRYIMATPRSTFHCNCFPDKVTKYRLGYIGICFVLAIVLTALFGITLRYFFTGISAPEAGGQMLLIAGTGWIVQMVLALIIIKDKALDYIGHLGSVMVVGLLLLTPWMLFYFLTGIQVVLLPALSVLASSAYMLYLHVQRTKYLEMSPAWTLSWFLLLQSTALFWIYIFHLK